MERFNMETGFGTQALLLAHTSPSSVMKKPEVERLTKRESRYGDPHI